VLLRRAIQLSICSEHRAAVARLATELSRQVSVYASILDNNSVLMPPNNAPPNWWLSLDAGGRFSMLYVSA
jgi:hypothetical protein